MGEAQSEIELGIAEIINLYLGHWRMFFILGCSLLCISSVVYCAKVPYIASSTIVVNDSQNSSTQAFSNQFFGLSKAVQETKKGSSQLTKHIEYLKTREFFELLLARIEIRGNSPEITLEERLGFEIFKENYLKNLNSSEDRIEVLQRLDKFLRVQLDSEFQVKMIAVNVDKSLALFLSNTASALATEVFKARELAEIIRVEGFMAQQKTEADQKLRGLSQQLADIQIKDEGILPLASQEKMGEYVSELFVRSNEIKLKIAENKKAIEFMEQNRSGQRESGLFGLAGKIETLKVENNLLSGKLSQVQASADHIKKEVRTLPFAAQKFEDLKKKSDLEFNRYKELNTALAKIEAQKMSVESRFEVLDKARWETTVPQIGMMTLVLMSFLLSQIIGSAIIYFRYLWNPRLAYASSHRDLMIFANHSIDPHVVIENSKIKLSLKKPDGTKDTKVSSEVKDPHWNMVNVATGSEATQ